MKTKLKKVAIFVIIAGLTVLFLIFFRKLHNIIQLNNVPDVSVEEGVTYLKFPFEKLAELPQEPNWETDGNAWEILEEVRGTQTEEINNFIKEEVKRSGSSSFKYVNKNGDIMISKEISLETTIYDNIALFRSNSNNLVVIEYRIFMTDEGPVTTSIYRFEYFSTTQQFTKDVKFVAKNNEINGNQHYIWRDNTLYYIVKCNEEWNIKKVATGEKISGYVEHIEENITYPIIKKDNQLYTYVVENALANEYAYYVESDSIIIKEVKLSESEGTFTTEQDLIQNLYIEGYIEQGNYMVSMMVSEKFSIPESTTNFAECCKQIISTKSYYLNSSGNDDYIFSYWGKDGTANHYF